MSLKIESSSLSITYVESLLLQITKMKNNVYTKIKTGQFNGLACDAIINQQMILSTELKEIFDMKLFMAGKYFHCKFTHKISKRILDIFAKTVVYGQN